MRALLFSLFILSNIHLILSNIVCDEPISGRINPRVIKKDPDDIIEIKFSGLVSQVKELSFETAFNFNTAVVQANAKTIDFELSYKENGDDKIMNCRYDVPKRGDVLRAFVFRDLNVFTQYILSVGYTLNSGKSFMGKDSKMFTTCFGQPDAPTNVVYNIAKDCTLTVSWKEPQIVNAPSVCYYEVKYRDNTGSSKTTPVESTSLKLTVKPNLKYNFFIQSINNHTCYASQFPSAQQCLVKQTASRSETFSFNSDSQCTNSNASVKTTFNTLFLIILLIHIFKNFKIFF